jgi:thiamine pyrophosphokinase
MSSHHIIREDQEPALVIDDAENLNYENIQQLLEWSPTVLVTEQALETVLSWGIKIDIVIALEQHVEELKISLQDQFPLKILSCHAEAEAIDTAIYFLTASKQKAVNVISNDSLEPFEKFPSLDVAVIQNGKRWVFIRTGHFEKWLPAGTTITIYPTGAHPEPVIEKEGIVTVHRDHSFWISEMN